MCIICEMTELAVTHSFVAHTLSESVQGLGGITTQLICAMQSIKDRGIALDAKEERAYADALAFLGSRPEKPAQPSSKQVDEIKEELSKATGVPKDKIVYCTSPEQAEALIEKEMNSNKKSH